MRKPSGMFCFSPPVMLATFIIEFGLAAYVFLRYKTNKVGRVVIALLVLLGAFQVMEYNVCTGGFIEPMWASRLGYVAITMLPPLGIHLIYAMTNMRPRWLVPTAYFTGFAFAIFFLTIGQGISEPACVGNYVIFSMAPGSEYTYSVYYYGWEIVGAVLAWNLARIQKPNVHRALLGLIIGYLALMVPTTTVNLIDPTTLAGIPSIMCGFAVILAVILAFWVMPQAGKKR